MDIDLPIRGLDELQPLAAWVIIYIVLLVFIRLFFWPTLLTIRKRNALGKLVAWLGLVASRIAIFGLLLLGFLWALSVLGLEADFFEALLNLPDLELNNLGVIVPGALILLAVLVYFVIRPAFSRPRAKK